jgi:hypothetical protein
MTAETKEFKVHLEALGDYTGSYTEHPDGTVVIDTIFDPQGELVVDDDIADKIWDALFDPGRFDHEDNDPEEDA